MLAEQITKDYIQAMKDKDSLKSSTLSFLRAQIKNVQIDKRGDHLDDTDVIAVIKKQVKQRQDSIEQYTQGARPDLADKETKELVILKSYLPAELAESELENMIRAMVKEVNAASMKDMGVVMKAVNTKVAGRADNRMVSDLVKKILSSL